MSERLSDERLGVCFSILEGAAIKSQIEVGCGRQISALREVEAELRSLRAENSKMRNALLVVKAGIWREKEHNACGINCAAAAVHMVEEALKEELP